MHMDAYILIGNANTRKTSVVRSLTGCFNRSVRDIQLQSSRRPQRFYARVGTLQITRTSIEDFIQEVNRSRCEAVVFCLSPTAHRTDLEEFPDAQTYVAALRERGWRIKGVAVLGQDGGGVRAPNLRQYTQAPTAPVNVTARDVRAQFGWL
ncbi:MAG: hypothetical protein Q8S71_07940 [Hydrogenophaga sp.]|jgi:hypothetical protein|uniref:hypothetical protein n=2 Tax=Hydrogenophaga sp. TaxID=1904254 RepID=UPI00272F8333|nr:hypothetical protein [Hydrogenophaga sp.]MDP2407775.1 hypothetical protein [Hydrogenophaga sp.]MDP3323457.1 hypothetical protein [Hydrogenophaga sp.]MDP3884885.1 hypothetical protein [Hydrogenophaga sp.]